MSISSLVDYEASVPVDVTGPDGKPLGWTWHVKSINCEAATKAQRKATAKSLAGQIKAGKKGADEEVVTDMMETHLSGGSDITALCVTGWDVSAGLSKAHADEDFEFKPANVKRFMDNVWLAPQITEAANEITNFTS